LIFLEQLGGSGGWYKCQCGMQNGEKQLHVDAGWEAIEEAMIDFLWARAMSYQVLPQFMSLWSVWATAHVIILFLYSLSTKLRRLPANKFWSWTCSFLWYLDRGRRGRPVLHHKSPESHFVVILVTENRRPWPYYLLRPPLTCSTLDWNLVGTLSICRLSVNHLIITLTTPTVTQYQSKTILKH
jgi:hypothetical protein